MRILHKEGKKYKGTLYLDNDIEWPLVIIDKRIKHIWVTCDDTWWLYCDKMKYGSSEDILILNGRGNAYSVNRVNDKKQKAVAENATGTPKVLKHIYY